MRSGDQLGITAQLIEAATDRHLWAETYHKDLRDVLALQDEVGRSIANQVQIKLSTQEQIRLASARPVNPEPYEAYLNGRYEWNEWTEENLKKSSRNTVRLARTGPNPLLFSPPHTGYASNSSG